MKVPKSTTPDFRVSFLSEAFKKRIERSMHEKDLLRKALGKDKNLRILDATAGLCRETLRMAYWGHHVWACEKNRELAHHLQLAFEEARGDEFYASWISRVTFVSKATEDFLTNEASFDVIVIDPMFSEERRKALPKKDLQFLGTLVGHDDNSEFLLKKCLPHVSKKLLLKRPLKASTLLKPLHSVIGRAHRWDVYAPQTGL